MLLGKKGNRQGKIIVKKLWSTDIETGHDTDIILKIGFQYYYDTEL
jgi:hypothetical protein